MHLDNFKISRIQPHFRSWFPKDYPIWHFWSKPVEELIRNKWRKLREYMEKNP